MTKPEEYAQELIAECGLAEEADRARAQLMLELVRRVGRVHGRIQKHEHGAPKATAKQKQIREAIKQLAVIRRACDRLDDLSSTWSEGGPLGSPELARWSVARRLLAHLVLPTPPSDSVRTWSSGGQRFTGTHWIGPEIVPHLSVGDHVANPIRDTRATMDALADVLFVFPEYFTSIIDAYGQAAMKTLAELEAQGQTQRSETARDLVMRDLALVFHALHRRTRAGERGSKAALARFVHRALASFHDGISEAAVRNRLRKPVFFFGKGAPGVLPDIPKPEEVDAEGVLAALRQLPGSSVRAAAIRALGARLGPAAGIVMLDP